MQRQKQRPWSQAISTSLLPKRCAARSLAECSLLRQEAALAMLHGSRALEAIALLRLLLLMVFLSHEGGVQLQLLLVLLGEVAGGVW